MSQFNATVLTHNGLDLLTRAQAGQVRIQFTRIGIGDGYPPTDLRDLLNLVNEIKSLPILDIKLSGNGQTQIKAVFGNEGLTTGVYFREIGLFANDPVKGEILYSVANAGSTADYLPPSNGIDYIEEILNFVTVIGNATDVTAVIEQKALVTVDTFEEHVNDTSIHIPRSEFDSEIASLRNEINLIKATFPDSFTHNLFTEDLSTLADIDLSRGYYNQAQSRLEV